MDMDGEGVHRTTVIWTQNTQAHKVTQPMSA